MRLLLPLFATLLFLSFPALATSERKPSDVRVLIDISGSMKKTDPDNLRRPALDLLVRLLPEDAKAGVWTFGQSVNMIVPHQSVTPSWRSSALPKAQAVNSVGLFTNIGAALDTASFDRALSSTEYQRHIVLLTDGVVDVSKNPADNNAATDRIYTEILPALINSGYRIHTIALSDNADSSLLKRLSSESDGVFAIAKDADALMSTFLRIFDQAVPQERVPLDEDGFLIDASVQEFTALIFRAEKSSTTSLVAPDGSRFNATNTTHRVRWHRSDSYDLITVTAPAVGRWKVDTAMAPNSRITVVSNLQLAVAPLAHHVKQSSQQPLHYYFTEAERPITQPEFLALLSADVRISDENTVVSTSQFPTTQPSDGIFRELLSVPEVPGSYDVVLTVDGKTFTREFLHHFTVIDSVFRVQKEKKGEDESAVYHYTLSAAQDVVDPATVSIQAVISGPEGTGQVDVRPNDNGEWTWIFLPPVKGRYDISFDVRASLAKGGEIHENIFADRFAFPSEASLLISSVAPNGLQPEPEAEDVPDAKTPLWLYLLIGLGNLIVIGVGIWAIRSFLMKRQSATSPEPMGPSTTDEIPTLNTVIDVSDEDVLGSMPMTDSVVMAPLDEASKANVSTDDLLADNLFPLDEMDDLVDDNAPNTTKRS